MRRFTLLLVLGSLVAFAGCAKEVGRIPFTGEGSGQSTVTLEPGEVDFWTDIDLEYEGDAAITYEVELSQGGAVIGKKTCNPLGEINVKMSWVETNLNDAHSRRGSGKMGCSMKIDAAGPAEVKAKLVVGKKPAKLEIRKIDLVVKQ